MDKAEASYFWAGAPRLVIDDFALRVVAALARALAFVRGRARKVMRALAIAVALVTTPGQG